MHCNTPLHEHGINCRLSICNVGVGVLCAIQIAGAAYMCDERRQFAQSTCRPLDWKA